MNVAAALAQARALGLERLDAHLLLAHALQQSRAWLVAHDDAALSPGQQQRFAADCRRRADGEPLAYVLGEREFHGLQLQVGPAVLVPRPDTETLVDWALELLPTLPAKAPAVVDLGTGSGAIALALKHAHPAARVCAVELSAPALAVAQANAERLRLDVASTLELHGQLGMVEAGPQRAYLRARRLVDARFTTMRVDVHNAFNTVTRAALMEAAQRVGDSLRSQGRPSPALAAACCAYDRPTRVFVTGSHAFESRRGVIQGCPLGSVLFDIFVANMLSSLPHLVQRDAGHVASAAGGVPEVRPMARVEEELSYDPNVVHVVALHDDVTIATSSPRLLTTVLRSLRDLLRDAGMTLARGKSEILSHRLVPSEVTVELDATPVEAALFAGAPLFTEAGVEQAERMVGAKADAALELMTRVAQLRDPQDIVKINAVAGCWTRLQYIHSLTKGLAVWEDILPTADVVTKSLLGTALGAHAADTSALSWAVALMPTARGGLGIPSSQLEASLNGDRLYRALESAERDPDAVLPVRQAVAKRRGKLLGDLSDHVLKACVSHPDARVRLKHQGFKSTASPFAVNANTLDATILSPAVASKVLHNSLLGDPLRPGVTLPCGEALHRDPLPAVGDDTLEHRVHLEACSLNVLRRHRRVIDALKRIADDIAPGVVKSEQTLDEWGNAVEARAEDLRPGDLTVHDGCRHLFVDFTASLSVQGVLREDSPTGSFNICDDACRIKRAKYAASFARVAPAAMFLPVALSGFGGASYVSTRALGLFAQAVERHAVAPTPLGTTSLARRMLESACLQVRAAAAQHSLDILAHHDARPQPSARAPFSRSCRRTQALAASLEEAARGHTAAAARAAALLRVLLGGDARACEDSEVESRLDHDRGRPPDRGSEADHDHDRGGDLERGSDADLGRERESSHAMSASSTGRRSCQMRQARARNNGGRRGGNSGGRWADPSWDDSPQAGLTSSAPRRHSTTDHCTDGNTRIANEHYAQSSSTSLERIPHPNAITRTRFSNFISAAPAPSRSSPRLPVPSIQPFGGLPAQTRGVFTLISDIPGDPASTTPPSAISAQRSQTPPFMQTTGGSARWREGPGGSHVVMPPGALDPGGLGRPEAITDGCLEEFVDPGG